jgi:aminomethyltransferase
MSDSIHADAERTLRISARRFEQSPYLDCYADPKIVFGVYAGRFYPTFIGEDPAEAYWALRRRAALYDTPERPVQIEGPDAVLFLERVFARRVATLKEGRGRYAIACTPKGGVFMDGLLFRLSEGTFWYVQPDGALETWLMAHGEGFDVTVSDPRSRAIQIQGPKSPEILRAASDGAIDERLGYFHAGYFDLGGQELYVSRTGWTAELGYEIYSRDATTDHKRLWDHLIAAGAAHGMVFSSAASMETRRIEAGILDNGTDMDMSMTPYQAGLGAFVDLDKPDFVGRAALIDADRRPLLYGVKCPAAAPAMGCAVLDGARAVGRVTAGAWSPFLACGIGYVRFAEPGAWAGRALSVTTPDGESRRCEIVELPFYDPEKRIPRGLDRSIP